ncbi:MAG: alkaline phosphatase PhoX [Planctomycetota bacterium]
MPVSRRDFLLAAGVVTLGFVGVSRLLAKTGASRGVAAAGPALNLDIYGALVRDPKGVLDLPRGFEYRLISKMGTEMADGLLVPGASDGMAAFAGPSGKTLIVRNHEISDNDPTRGPFGQDLSRFDPARHAVFDAGAPGQMPSLGGTTTIVYDTNRGTVEREFMSIAGTTRNCAGGPTPWGSWLTCEETVVRRGDQGRAKDHGWVFEVPATDEPTLADPTPITGMGRFNHEAIAVDPNSGVVYLTEDRGDGLLYRYIPNTPGKMLDGGRLQALAIKNSPSFDTRNWSSPAMQAGTTVEAIWIDVDAVDAPKDDLRQRGFDAGAARFARGEGIWWGNDSIYIVCTNGGPARKGQVFRLEPATSTDAADTLSLFVESHDGDILDMPDNATVAPNGDLYLCEDGSGEQFVAGVTKEGDLFKFARNALNTSEFAGACFSPDGTTMFLNLQHTGLTFAITGPWRSA